MSLKRTISGCCWRQTPATTPKKRCECGKECSNPLTGNNHKNFSRPTRDTKPGSNGSPKTCPKLWRSTIKLKRRRLRSSHRSAVQRLRPHWPNSSKKEKAPLHRDNHSSPLVPYSALTKTASERNRVNDHLSVGFPLLSIGKTSMVLWKFSRPVRRLLARRLTR